MSGIRFQIKKMSELGNIQEGREIGLMKGRTLKKRNLQAYHIGAFEKSV